MVGKFRGRKRKTVDNSNQQEFILPFGGQNADLVILANEEIYSYKTYLINLDADVADPSDYRIISDTLNSMTENDTAIWNITTYGGDLYTTIMLLNDIRGCKGQNYGNVVLGSSAGSIIALALDDCEVLQHGEMYIHEIQSHHSGSTSEQIGRLSFLASKQKKLMQDVYKDFLTDEEIDALINGRVVDMTLDDEECNRRLELRRKKRQVSGATIIDTNTKEHYCEEYYCEDCGLDVQACACDEFIGGK